MVAVGFLVCLAACKLKIFTVETDELTYSEAESRRRKVGVAITLVIFFAYLLCLYLSVPYVAPGSDKAVLLLLVFSPFIVGAAIRYIAIPLLPWLLGVSRKETEDYLFKNSSTKSEAGYSITIPFDYYQVKIPITFIIGVVLGVGLILKISYVGFRADDPMTSLLYFVDSQIEKGVLVSSGDDDSSPSGSYALYKFEVNGEEFSALTDSEYDRVVNIQYLNLNPNENRLYGLKSENGYVIRFVMSVFSTFGVLLYFILGENASAWYIFEAIPKKRVKLKMKKRKNIAEEVYFYADGKFKLGPFSKSELRSEELSFHTLVRKNNENEWKPLKDYKELRGLVTSQPKTGLEDPQKSINVKQQESSSSGSTPRVDNLIARIFSFKGRITRREYVLSYVIYFVAFLGIGFAIEEYNMHTLTWLVLPMSYVVIAQGAKRCHDFNRSGWFQLIPLWFVFAKGDSGDNRFGPNPR